MRSSNVLRSRLRRRVIVTLHTGEAFAGILYEADRDVWVLREAAALGAGENRTNLIVDGELLILTDDIAYCQMM